jgi:hypothetical protein
MKIYALCLVKNEDDVIRQSLLAASKWADKVFVYDNGSTDKTWDIVNELAKTNESIVAWRQDTKHYKNNLFGDIFNGVRDLANDGDWFCYQFPADEFYYDDPREFLSKVPKGYHVVKSQSIDYHLTFEDVEEFDFSNDQEFDREKVKYYDPLTYTEKRFFKYRKGMEWPAGNGHPKHIGIIYPKKIRVQHYQHRSPRQIQLRLDTRRQLVEDGYKFFKHAAQADWKEKLHHRSDLRKDNNDGKWQIDGIRYDNKPNPFLNFARKIAHRIGIFP